MGITSSSPSSNSLEGRAEEVQSLLNAVQELIIPYIRSADTDTYKVTQEDSSSPSENTHTALVDYKQPEELRRILQLECPAAPQGQAGLIQVVEKVLKYSVNTWHQGFLDKLYATTNPPGVAAELILATLNTNNHVYHVSPALSVIEKHTSKELAALFGLNGPNAGGISVQGGSASNMTSIVVARNTLFPSSKTDGYGDHKFVIFTSIHGHYSTEKAAQMLGFGSKAVWSLPVDKNGCIIPSELERLIQKAKAENRTPFYVCATAGTTVLGSFDPFTKIASICQKYGLWFHIDGSWGGSFIFSKTQKRKLAGSDQANSIAINPHKMLGAPVTCSFLLGADMRQFHRANTLPAGYLFHNSEEAEAACSGSESNNPDKPAPEIWDLADLTLQCGRRPDSLKLFLGWTYYGTEGYERQIDNACSNALHMASLIAKSPNLILVSENPPPCLQVCFYYAPGKQMVYPAGKEVDGRKLDETERGKLNSKVVETISHGLFAKGFMVDFAPPNDDEIGEGKFFRCVVNVQTKRETVEALVQSVLNLGPKVVEQLGA
ncbi:hypothetical protein FQN54_007217 [Arachnomyces sp. PD_36]|nr:hypothetical protein FQN54_007217 [Arachnomyces sp. PD_36]